MTIREYFEDSDSDVIILCQKKGKFTQLEKTSNGTILRIVADYKHSISDKDLIDKKIDELISSSCSETLIVQRNIKIDQILKN